MFYVRTSEGHALPYRGFSATSLPWCAQRKRPSGGCAGAGTHLPRASWKSPPSAQPGVNAGPRPAPGATPGVPLAPFYAFMLNQAGKPNAAERRKSSRSGSRLDEIGQARRRLYWRALRCSKQLKRPPQTARRPAEEQAERGAARTPALFSSANARTTARLLRGSSFLPSFLCFVFTYFPLYAASRVGKGSSFLLLPSLLPLFAALAFIRTLRLSTQFI